MALGDVAVAPKISATEGNGKLLNYMAVGLPTAAFDTSVNREILGDLGEYAELGSSLALAAAIEHLLVDDPAACERGRELRARVIRHFSWKRAEQQILDIYDLISRR